MRKRDEQYDRDSNWNAASPDEFLHITMGRDPAMPETIRGWVRERIKRGLNRWDDKQIVEAMELADFLEKENNKGRLFQK